MPGLEVAYRKFLQDVGRETGDPKWNIRHHPARKILDRFPAAFGEWVRHLEDLTLLKEAGYPFAKSDLSRTEWQGLAFLQRWRQRRPTPPAPP